MKSCEWRNGKLYFCHKAEKSLPFYEFRNDLAAMIKAYGLSISCNHCGCNLEPPAEIPIIIKSGGTWVSVFKNINYLWIPLNGVSTSYIGKDKSPLFFCGEGSSDKQRQWRDFQNVEITDDIAKLRPIVIITQYPGNAVLKSKLIGVQGARVISYTDTGSSLDFLNRTRIASVEDLEIN